MWRDLLMLTRREQVGFLMLTIILLGVIGLFFVRDFSKEEVVSDELQNWLAEVGIKESVTERKSKLDTVFFFNPNIESIQRLQLLGFNNHAIINLLKYREAGGEIKSAAKLKTIYGVDSVLFDKLEAYVLIDDNVGRSFQDAEQGYSHSRSNKKQNSKMMAAQSYVPDKPYQIEINSADTAILTLINGIGPVLSRRIVAYREKIGGYYSVDQLKEVYGLKGEVVDDNRMMLTVDEGLIEPVDISKASIRQMKNHPYLDFYMAKDIYECRKRGQLESIEQFKDSAAFIKADMVKLQKYFIVTEKISANN
ncbi:helix-hairpin-helix domain-containing protein [Carboxylicivirga taeanensis]|uniref:helix-hairpin-helix domain-containing protein n=1 Tax=Carboxylicivirga taeanensis TaxID=1416875 RepID=UPI003F6DC0F5